MHSPPRSTLHTARLKLTWPWLLALAVGWLLVAVVVLQSAQSLGPRPAWDWSPDKGPHILTPSGPLPLAAIETPQQVHLTGPEWHTPSPDAQPSRQAFEQMLAVEALLNNLEGKAGIAFVDTDGQRWPIRWESPGLPGLPWQLWIMVMAALLAWHVAIINWQINPRSRHRRLHAVIGLSYVIALLVRAWMMSRPWAWSATAVQAAFIGSHLMTSIFLGATLLLVLRLPQPLLSAQGERRLLGVLAVFCIADLFQLSPIAHVTAHQWPLASLGLVVVVHGLWQWHRHPDHDGYRVALRWFFMTLALSAIAPVTIFSLWPLDVGGASYINLTLPACVLPYLGLLALIHHRNLHQLEVRHWRAWAWVVALLASFCFVVGLVWHGGEWSSRLTIAATLSLPWFYMLSRAWLTPAETPVSGDRLTPLMPALLRLGARHRAGQPVEDDWQALLQQAFNPEHITRQARTEHAPAPKIQIDQSGRVLVLPTLEGDILRLQGADQRQRLFNHGDQQLALTLWRLASQTLQQTRDTGPAPLN